MNDNEIGLSAADVSQKKGTLKLATKFIGEYLDDPERFGPIPEGAAVVLLPPEDQGDSELRRANVRMAQRLTAEGRHVVLWTVGAQDPDESQILVPEPAGSQNT